MNSQNFLRFSNGKDRLAVDEEYWIWVGKSGVG